MDRHSPFDDRPELPPVPDVEADEGAMPVQSSGETQALPLPKRPQDPGPRRRVRRIPLLARGRRPRRSRKTAPKSPLLMQRGNNGPTPPAKANLRQSLRYRHKRKTD